MIMKTREFHKLSKDKIKIIKIMFDEKKNVIGGEDEDLMISLTPELALKRLAELSLARIPYRDYYHFPNRRNNKLK